MTVIDDTSDPRRAAILEHARKHFIREGFAATRMEPIARQAGVSTATLYAAFASKDALFSAVIRDASDDFLAQMMRVRLVDGDARTRILAFMTAYARFMGDPFVRSIFRLVMAERPRFRDVAMAFFDRGRSEFGAPLMGLIVELSKAGDLTCDRPSWAAGQLMGMIEHPVFFMPLVTGDERQCNRTVEQIAEDAVETFLARFGRQG